MKKLKAFKLKKKVWVIAAAFIFVIPSSAFAFNKGYSHFQVKQIVDQAKILSATGKYDEAISVLSLAENKWATKSLKGEVVSELEKNRDFEEQATDATESGTVTESSSPSPTPKIVKTESKQVSSPSPSPTTITYSPIPTAGYSPAPNNQNSFFYYDLPPVEDTGSAERERAYLESELVRLVALYDEWELRYEQTLIDVTAPIIRSIDTTFTARGFPLSGDLYEDTVAQLTALEVRQIKTRYDEILGGIQMQIDSILTSLGY